VTEDARPAPLDIQSAALLGLLSAGGALAFSFVRSKVTAVILGPDGVGLGAEIIQIAQTAAVPLALFTGPALVSSVASRTARGDEVGVTNVFRSAMTLGSALLALLSLGNIAAVMWMLSGRDPHLLVLASLAALAIIAAPLISTPTQVLTARGQLGTVAWLTLTLSATSSLLTVGGTYLGGLRGQFCGIAAAQVLYAYFNLQAARRRLPSVLLTLRPFIDREFVIAAVQVGGAGLVAGIFGQGSLLVARWALDRHGGSEANGQFQCAWTLASVSMGTVLNALGSFAFPRFAAAKNSEVLDAELRGTVRFVAATAPLVMALGLPVRRIVVHAIFSSRFDPAIEILGIMMATDVAKAVSWASAGPLLYRGKVAAFVVTESVAAVCLAGGAAILIPMFGLVGVGYAYGLSYFVYLPVAALVTAKSCGVRFDVPGIAVGYVVSALGFAFVHWLTPYAWAAVALPVVGLVWFLVCGGARSAVLRGLVDRMRAKLTRDRVRRGGTP